MRNENAVNWEDIATIYDKETNGRPARTLPMDYIFRWAVKQTDRFYVKGDYLYYKEEN